LISPGYGRTFKEGEALLELVRSSNNSAFRKLFWERFLRFGATPDYILQDYQQKTG